MRIESNNSEIKAVDPDELRSVKILHGMQLSDLARIASVLVRRNFPANSLILSRDTAADHLYLLLDGSVRVEQRDENGLIYNLTELHPGDLLGEHAVLSGLPRSADVRAVSDVCAARLARTDFDNLLVEIPTLYGRICRHLALQLGDWAQRHHRDESENREVLSNLIGWQLLPEFDAFPGNTTWIRSLNQRLQLLGASGKHVLVVGEHGTWKDLAARLIHTYGNQSRPLLFLDCAAPPSLHRGQHDSSRVRHDSLVLELAQESALFGHAQDGTHLARRGRRGMLELANGGDLILRNLHSLTPGMQDALLAFIESGRFRRRGESAWRNAMVRIIAATSENLAGSQVDPAFNQQLYQCLAIGLVETLPLRERKKEIPAIARSLLDSLNRKHHKQVRRFSQDALNRLVDHDWPLNTSELYQVLSRAVAQSPGDEIDAEQIYLSGHHHGQDGHRLNLLTVPEIEHLASNPAFPRLIRWVSTPLFLLVMLYSLFGPNLHNPANLAVWTVWWPLLLMTVFFMARGWCSFCPMEAISDSIGVTRRVVREPFRWLRRWGPWISLVGLAIVLLIEQATGMFMQAFGTGLLLLALLSATVLSDLMLGRRGWCKYLCPLGRVVGLFSRISLLEMHSNQNVCLSRCKVDDCIKEKGCPMGLHPTGINNSDHCVLCLDCVRNCPHHAMQLDLRNPLWGLLSRNRGGYAEAMFAVVVIAVVIAIRLIPLISGKSAGLFQHAQWSLQEFVSALLVVLAYCCLVLLSSLDLQSHRWRVTLNQCGLAYMPLAFCGIMAIYVRAVVEGGGDLIPYLLETLQLALLLDAERLTPELGSFSLLIPLSVLLCGLFSWRVLGRVQVRYALERWPLIAHRTMVVITMLLFFWLL